jgi:hypothetical protein
MIFPRVGQESALLVMTVFPRSKLMSPPLKLRKKGLLKGTIMYIVPVGRYLTSHLFLAVALGIGLGEGGVNSDA